MTANKRQRRTWLLLTIGIGVALVATLSVVLVTADGDRGPTAVGQSPGDRQSVTQSPNAPSQPACLTGAQAYEVIKHDFDEAGTYKVYGDVTCQDGWATAEVGSTTPSESPENAFYLLQHTGSGWTVVAFGTDSWLFEPKPLCQRVPDRIAERLCLKTD